MSAYYVDLVDGSDGDDGSEATPWKDLRYAMRMLSAGDTLIVMGSTALVPFRIRQTATVNRDHYSILFDANYNVIGDGMQHVLMSTNLTHGEPAPDLFEAVGTMDRWLSSTTMWQANLGGDLPTKNTSVTAGSAAMQMMRYAGSGSNWNTQEQQSADFEGTFTLRLKTVDFDATASLGYRLRDITNGKEFQASTGTWEVGSITNYIPNRYPGHSPTGVDFVETVVTGPMPNAGANARFDLYLSTATLLHGSVIDEVSFRASTDGSENNVWAQVQSGANGNVYSIPALEPTLLWTCANSAWESDGIEALENLGDPNISRGHGGLSTFADVLTTHNSWAWSGGELRVNLGDATIADTHIEMFSHNDRVYVRNDSDCMVGNLHFAGHQSNVAWKRTLRAFNTKYSHAWACLQVTDEGAAQAGLFRRIEVYKGFKDGCAVSGATSAATAPVFEGGYFHDNLDEGIQAIYAGTYTARGCVATRNGSAAHGGGSGFAAESTGSAFALENCTAFENWGGGITCGTSTDAADSSLNNVVSYGNDTGGGGAYDINEFSATNDMTITNTHFGTQISTAIVSGVSGNLQLTESPFSGAGVPTLADSAAAVGAGERWWTGANPIGYDGEPFPDVDLDIGGVQTSRGVFHPTNL